MAGDLLRLAELQDVHHHGACKATSWIVLSSAAITPTACMLVQEASTFSELKKQRGCEASPEPADTGDFASIVASVAATRAAEANLQMNCGTCETCLNTQVRLPWHAFNW